ncbi:MAG: hypothetical protein U5K72_10250 [Balneolaceae bacterium]|nr:hypothetical protein [Balneolaceae bacterium]
MKKLVIKEKYSKYWPTISMVSLILAVVLFVIYQMIDNVLWVGYIRLASFSMFALALLSFFKVKDGQVEIIVKHEDEVVESIYKVRNEVIFQAKHPVSDFYKLKVDQMPDKSLYNNFVKSDKCVRFRRKNENAWYYFNEIESRVIPLNKENASKLYDFLKQASAL